MKIKKQKLLLGICSSATALALAGGAVGLVYGLRAKDAAPFFNTKTVTFDAGGSTFKNGASSVKVEAGTTLDRVAQPQVVCQRGRTFAGWQMEGNKLALGQERITSDLRLTATFNETSSLYATVNFIPGSSGATLQGNTVVSARKHYYFYMINRPQATATQTGGRDQYFLGWKYNKDVLDPEDGKTILHKAGEVVSENDEILGDWVLEPYFNQAVTITWEPGTYTPGGGGEPIPGSRVRGSMETTLSKGTLFEEFNQPQLSAGNGVFQGWYDENTGTKISGDTPINVDMTLTAHWGDAPEGTSKYVKLSFSAESSIKGAPEFIISPSSSVIVANDTAWEGVNKPTITDADNNFKVDDNGWLWRMSNGTEEEATKWQKVSKGTTFPKLESPYTQYDVKANMIYSVDQVIVTGANESLPESYVELSSQVTGGTKIQDVTWKLYDRDQETPLDASIAHMDGEKNNVVRINSLAEPRTFYAQATSTVDTSVKSDMHAITVYMPYEDSSYYWYHTTGETGNGRWVAMTSEDLCSGSSTIPTYYLDGTAGTAIDKEDTFERPIFIGRNLLQLRESFMKGWTGFNAPIDFGDSNIRYITAEAFAGCTSFNQMLDLHKIKSIGSNFLADCTSYNMPIDLSKSSELTEIGSNFLQGCTSFNAEITFPGKISGKDFRIYDHFLYRCYSFCQPITLPSYITYIGDFFMNECKNFGGDNAIVTVECPISKFIGKEYCFCASDEKRDPIANTGFAVASSDAKKVTEFQARFPTMTSTQGYEEHVYRKLKGSSAAITKAEFDAAFYKLYKTDSITVKSTYTEYDESGGSSSEYATILYNDEIGVKSWDADQIEQADSIDFELEDSYGDYWAYDENGNITSFRGDLGATSWGYMSEWFLKQYTGLNYGEMTWVATENCFYQKNYTTEMRVYFNTETKDITGMKQTWLDFDTGNKTQENTFTCSSYGSTTFDVPTLEQPNVFANPTTGATAYTMQLTGLKAGDNWFDIPVLSALPSKRYAISFKTSAGEILSDSGWSWSKCIYQDEEGVNHTEFYNEGWDYSHTAHAIIINDSDLSADSRIVFNAHFDNAVTDPVTITVADASGYIEMPTYTINTKISGISATDTDFAKSEGWQWFKPDANGDVNIYYKADTGFTFKGERPTSESPSEASAFIPCINGYSSGYIFFAELIDAAYSPYFVWTETTTGSEGYLTIKKAFIDNYKTDPENWYIQMLHFTAIK